MMRMVAALERISASAKAKSEALFLERVKKLGSYWPLGRVGARVLFHATGASVVDKLQAEKWLTRLLELIGKRLKVQPLPPHPSHDSRVIQHTT